MPDNDAPTQAATIADFLAGAEAVAVALARTDVRDRWQDPSVLEGQTVGALACHLARGGVWVVGDYLAHAGPRTRVTYDSAADYYAELVAPMGTEGHEAVRARAAALAEGGHGAMLTELRARLPAVTRALAEAEDGTCITVINDVVMRLDRYLDTRILEQAVHLDDLARSIGVDALEYPERCIAIALRTGLEIGCSRYGTIPMLRALFRDSVVSVLPVI